MDDDGTGATQTPTPAGLPVPSAAPAVGLPPAVALFQAAIRALSGVDRDALGSRELLEFTRQLETGKRQLPALEHAVVADLAERGVAGELFVPNTAALLRLLLRISPGEANRRVKAAADLGPRRGLTGERLPPLFATVAAAQATGAISAEHAHVITRALDALPAAVEADHGTVITAELLTRAHEFDPRSLTTLARRLHDCYDPDGTAPTHDDHQRHRSLALARRRDGAYDLRGTLTPECGAPWATTLDDAVAGTGTARTPRGDLIPTRQAVQLAGDGQVFSVLFDPHGAILDFGHTRRLATPAQRLAVTARDHGCTMPGCDRPAAWCQVNHMTEHANGGPTDISNLALLCGYHNRNQPRMGSKGVMINGRPHWIPTAWADPAQTPTRNTHHDITHAYSPD